MCYNSPYHYCSKNTQSIEVAWLKLRASLFCEICHAIRRNWGIRKFRRKTSVNLEVISISNQYPRYLSASWPRSLSRFTMTGAPWTPILCLLNMPDFMAFLSDIVTTPRKHGRVPCLMCLLQDRLLWCQLHPAKTEPNWCYLDPHILTHWGRENMAVILQTPY